MRTLLTRGLTSTGQRSLLTQGMQSASAIPVVIRIDSGVFLTIAVLSRAFVPSPSLSRSLAILEPAARLFNAKLYGMGRLIIPVAGDRTLIASSAKAAMLATPSKKTATARQRKRAIAPEAKPTTISAMDAGQVIVVSSDRVVIHVRDD